MNWKSTVLVSGAGLLATWLGVSSTPTGPAAEAPVTAAARAPRASAAAGAASDIQQEAAHLQTRLRAAADYRPPVRNPFEFTARPRPAAPRAARTAGPPVVSPILPSAAAPPPFTLAGIGATNHAGTMEYTAVLSTSSGVVLAHVGDVVGDGDTIGAIDENGITLRAADGTVRRLLLPR